MKSARWLLLGLAGCASAPAVQQRTPNPTNRTPLVAERLVLPAGTHATAVWAATEGGGVIALDDGSLYELSVSGVLSAIDRAPGESPMADERPVRFLAESAPGAALASVPGGALWVQYGLAHRAEMPTFVQSATGYVRFGAEVLWATGDGLTASDGDHWVSLASEAGAVRDARALLPAGTGTDRRAWVQTATTLRQVRYTPGPTPAVSWFDPAAPLGTVAGAASMGDAQAAVRNERGVVVFDEQHASVFTDTTRGVPDAIGGGGGWAWVLWDHQVLRTNGDRWELLARDPSLGAGVTISVDRSTGATALLLDTAGSVVHIEAEPVLRVSGLEDATVVLNPWAELEVVVADPTMLTHVSFTVDGASMPASTRDAAPWGWGTDGARRRDFTHQTMATSSPPISYGAHSVSIDATYGGQSLHRVLRFEYTSPLGRVPGYAADIVPLYQARCARCHTGGVARELSTFGTLSDNGAALRTSIVEARMPPDLLLDPASAAVFISWVDGDTPP